MSYQFSVAEEWSMESDVNARVEYNDNIFITNKAHDSVTGLIVTPTIHGLVKEDKWQADLSARLRANRYSDKTLDSVDQYFSLTGSFNEERHRFSLNLTHDLDSNLSAASSDFALIGRRINRKIQRVTPAYTYLATERLSLSLSYTYSDVDYFDAENTGFTPYIAETGVATARYNLTERDLLTFSLQGVDYTSKNESTTYLLLISRLGIEHEFSKTLSFDFLAGVSRRNSTNTNTQTFDFNGRPITRAVVNDFSDRGFVLDSGIKKLFETSSIEGRVSRDNTTNSFGGLNQVDKYKLDYRHSLTELWRYAVRGRYEDISAISSGTRSTDRQILFFETLLYYKLNRDWQLSASYRYVQRKFKDSVTGARAPKSNRIYFGLTYNFPTLSTF